MRFSSMKRVTFSPPALIFLILLAAVIGAVATWYKVDRSGMTEALCSVGLPNPTLPDVVDDRTLQCAAFKPKQRYLGTIRKAGEYVFFESHELRDEESPHGSDDGSVSIECPRGQCLRDIEAKLDKFSIEMCGGHLPRMGFAGAILEGRVTEKYFGLGNSDNASSRVLLIDRIVEVFDPAGSEMAEWRKVSAAHGECL